MSQLIKFDETNLAGIHWANVYKVCVAVCTSESDAYGSVVCCLQKDKMPWWPCFTHPESPREMAFFEQDSFEPVGTLTFACARLPCIPHVSYRQLFLT